MKEKRVLVALDLLSVFIFQGAGIHQWPPHPVISRHLSRHCHFLPWLAHSKSDILTAPCTCRSTGYRVLSFRISSRSLPTSVLFLFSIASLLYCPHQLEVQEVNESGNGWCFLLRFWDKAANFCCVCVQMSRLCLPLQAQSYWITVGFNDSHGLQEKFLRTSQVCSKTLLSDLVPHLSFTTVWLSLVFSCLKNSSKQDEEDCFFWLTRCHLHSLTFLIYIWEQGTSADNIRGSKS